MEEALPMREFSKSREGTKDHVSGGRELRVQYGSHSACPQESLALETLSMAQPLDTTHLSVIQGASSGQNGKRQLGLPGSALRH